MILTGSKIAFRYNSNAPVIKNVDFSLAKGERLGLIGRNGSGKSTLLKIACGYLSPNKGEQSLFIQNKEIPKAGWMKYIGFAAPYINLYDELTIKEHFALCAKARYIALDEAKLDFLLAEFSIAHKKNSAVKSLSTGMRQKSRLALSFYFDYAILAFDEPTATLDSQSSDAFFKLCENSSQNGVGIIIATNDNREKAFCNNFVNL